MDNNELIHWGIKGMRWGIRRFQNKDGSLTAAGKKRRGIDDRDDGDDFVVGAANKGASKNNHDNDTESTEAKRERLLKSTNASELYKNRNLLTTAELNERLNRIDTERRLSEAAAKESKPKKTAIDKVNTILKYGNKINDIYNFTQTPVMKALKKKLFGSKTQNYSMPLDKIWKMKDSLPTEELSKAIQRSNAEKAIKKALDDAAEERMKERQKALDSKSQKAKNILPFERAKEEGINTSSSWKNASKTNSKYDSLYDMKSFMDTFTPNTVETSSNYKQASMKPTKYDKDALYNDVKISNREANAVTNNSSLKWKDVSVNGKYSGFVNSGEEYIDKWLK